MALADAPTVCGLAARLRQEVVHRPAARLGLTGVARTVGDQKGSQLRSHVAARRIMLAQETRQRSGRNRFQETARTLVAGCTRTRKELGSAFACFEILRLRPGGRTHKATGQKRD